VHCLKRKKKKKRTAVKLKAVPTTPGGLIRQCLCAELAVYPLHVELAELPI